MYLSRMWVFVAILAYLELTTGDKTCWDCTLIEYCKEAKEAIETSSNSTAILNAKCGTVNNQIQVCCSDFESVHSRFALPTNKQSTEESTVSCGKIVRDRIKGGELADMFEFPWMVVLVYDEPSFKCAGTLISPLYVLTAAHCVVNMDLRSVIIGDYALDTEKYCDKVNCEEEIQIIDIEDKETPIDYDRNTYNNDIALLRLKSKVKLPLRNADIICLPTEETQNEAITDKSATVTGWGMSEYTYNSTLKLRKVVIPVRSTEFCQRFYTHFYNPEANLFCAGTNNKDACKGDSGGPLLIETQINGDTKYVQFGIVSHGPDGECAKESPGIYTDIRKHMKWIKDTMKD